MVRLVETTGDLTKIKIVVILTLEELNVLYVTRHAEKKIATNGRNSMKGKFMVLLENLTCSFRTLVEN